MVSRDMNADVQSVICGCLEDLLWTSRGSIVVVWRVSFGCKNGILWVSRGHLVGVKNDSRGCRNILIGGYLVTAPWVHSLDTRKVIRVLFIASTRRGTDPFYTMQLCGYLFSSKSNLTLPFLIIRESFFWSRFEKLHKTHFSLEGL